MDAYASSSSLLSPPPSVSPSPPSPKRRRSDRDPEGGGGDDDDRVAGFRCAGGFVSVKGRALDGSSRREEQRDGGGSGYAQELIADHIPGQDRWKVRTAMECAHWGPDFGHLERRSNDRSGYSGYVKT